ncbi:hypothetical protein KFK09_000291 [Dendrobium nobile]|uniref:Uncharacterized protein n=1 Tax=Dendrobium nobile TaxID=94219 RepID=A0A8T3CE94_DENNO|nr:hypothetical protein KFK09_000291 [Dendrobium nobile]
MPIKGSGFYRNRWGEEDEVRSGVRDGRHRSRRSCSFIGPGGQVVGTPGGSACGYLLGNDIYHISKLTH